jgi:hypothetical protein
MSERAFVSVLVIAYAKSVRLFSFKYDEKEKELDFNYRVETDI